MPRTDRGSRIVAAPIERVYAALVDPAAIETWMPPNGMTGRVERFEPHPGGAYRMVLTYRDDSASPGKSTPGSDIVDARFVEVVPNRRLCFAVDFVSADPSFNGTMTMTWQVTDVAGGTRVDITADGVPDGISAEDHATGIASSLANLAEYVESGGKLS